MGRGAGLVVAGDAGAEAQHAQNIGPKPQKHNQPPGISRAHHAPTPTIPRCPDLPSWGCFCPQSLLPPLATLDSKALHWTERGRVCRIPARGWELHPVLAQWSQMYHTSVLRNTGIAQHWSPFQERNAGVWPGKEGCAWTYWKLYTGVAVPSSWPRAIPRPTPQTPGDPQTCKQTVLCGQQEKVQLQR